MALLGDDWSTYVAMLTAFESIVNEHGMQVIRSEHEFKPDQ